MPSPNRWYRDPSLWLEAFVIVNLGFLSLDIYLAHSVNRFEHDAEYIPLWFSMAAPPLLLLGLLHGLRWGWKAVWRDVGYLVGWCAIAIGLVGVILHLDSRFFHERTIKSLVYAAPFAAPLAYTGLGLLLVMNRMVDRQSEEWPRRRCCWWGISSASAGAGPRCGATSAIWSAGVPLRSVWWESSCTSTVAFSTSGRSKVWCTRRRLPPRWHTPAWAYSSS